MEGKVKKGSQMLGPVGFYVCVLEKKTKGERQHRVFVFRCHLLEREDTGRDQKQLSPYLHLKSKSQTV